MNILYLDNEEELLQLFKDGLNSSKHRVYTARTIEDALYYCKKIDFDKVVLDLHLGKRHGQEVIDFFLREKSKKMPTIQIVSGYPILIQRFHEDYEFVCNIEDVYKKPEGFFELIQQYNK